LAKKLIIFACISLLAGVRCWAAIITVDPNGSADYTTIQAGINDANDGDIVLVADGTYTGPGNRDIDFLGKAITVKSANGQENCIIDCQDSGRGFYFHNGEDPNSILDGFTILDGENSGIYCNSSSPIITNCTISGCSSGNAGGGICCVGGRPYIINCIISSNRASCFYCGGEGGGGIYLNNCQAFISESIITNNSAYGYYEFEDCEIDPAFGGGLYIKSSNATINNCIISGNNIYIAGGGGGIACDNSTVLINNCTITSNDATGYEDYLCDCCGAVGGGLYNCIGTIRNCTIIGNNASGYYGYGGYGGGLASCGGTITNCIVRNNTADDDGDQIYSSSTPTYSCIQDWTGGGIGNIDSDPLFFQTGEPEWYLDPNGTPTDPNDDFWILLSVEPDYHLKSESGRWDPNSQIWVQDAVTSPCIDAGNPNDPNYWELEELWPNGHRVNIGAYGNTPEASRSCMNIDDVQLMAGDWLQADSVTDIIPYPDGDGIVDLRDYAFVVLHWLCSEQ
jgi:hypothetical protein